jgi:hypothetical protein
MKHKLLIFVPAFFLLMAGCQEPVQKSSDAVATSPIIGASSSAPINFPCLNKPAVNYNTPGDTPITSQDGVNCFAWQTFIGLNWPVDANNPGEPDKSASASNFGEPGLQQPLVWETYANTKSIFRANAQPPLPWGQQPEVPSSCQQMAQQLGVRVMQASRMSGSFNMSKEASQAFPGNNPNWLADKNGNLVYYEILIGKDEYEYINANGLYNANMQAEHIKQHKNIAMPLGHDNVQGGLEIKAAWLSVSDPENSKWKHYKTSTAVIYDPATLECHTSTMALVGMHIIHKTASQPQWIWATFEHKDNAPDTASIKTNGSVDGDYTFYSDSCSVKQVPASCKPKTIDGAAVTQTSCEVNVSPAYYLDGSGNCPAYPIQVSRDFAIKDSTDNHVASLNKAAQQMIANANADSVFANYQLVNVLWSSAAVNDNVPPGNPPLTPLSTSGETPSLNTVPVANTMLETYAQGFNCLSCHAYASVARDAKAQLGGKAYATDYSFIFGLANIPATTKPAATK